MSGYRKKLIEVALPLEAINVASAREKSIRHGHPSTLHLWWARRPLAAARAVLFAQLVDDPSSWPELFPTEEAQNAERQRLFRLIEDLVKWENSNKENVIGAARLEIARSHARGSASDKAKKILTQGVKREIVDEYLATELPPVHDPFAGGGTIPLEAQRLGLRAIATDLNPVAVLINKALIEIPSKFAGKPPVNPESRANGRLTTWTGAEGLADDVRYYGAWMREEAKKRIGHLYPEVELPKEHGGGKATVIAWIWARTVESPNPAFAGSHVPLLSTYWLSTKNGRQAWLEPVIDRQRRTWLFKVRSGTPSDKDAIDAGTKQGRGDFSCLLSGTPMPGTYLRDEGRAGRMSARIVAAVAEGPRGRTYLPATREQEEAASVPVPESAPQTELPEHALGFRVQNYGITRHRDLHTPRQLVLLTTLCELVELARAKVVADAGLAGDPQAYANGVALYLGLGVSKLADYNSNLVTWSFGRDQAAHVFTRQALSMIWSFAEIDPFAEAAGDYAVSIAGIVRTLSALPIGTIGTASQADAVDSAKRGNGAVCLSTDPPYYDNIGYADLSDFFYVWLRAALKNAFPNECSTLLVPKAAELIANPFRHGDKAEDFFLDGMRRFLEQQIPSIAADLPATIYYAFKQTEAEGASTSSTGWETFLSAVLSAGFSINGTLPIRSERPERMRSLESNALASSVVLVCRPRPEDASAITRGEFRRTLRKELPIALRGLQQGNIAPVDVAQASIGPGMAIFSRHKQVAEADGATMSVRSALQLINEVLDEYLASGEGDFDSDTRFAITWHEQHGWEAGAYGDAENIAKARNISVQGVVEAGICRSGAGKVRLLKREELPAEYDPAADERPTVWEFTQHMIRYLEDQGEEAAARHLRRLGPSRADATRELAYRLYNTCERKKWAEDARAYNGLILAWPELEKLAARMTDESVATAPGSPGKKGKKSKASTKGQQDLFKGDTK